MTKRRRRGQIRRWQEEEKYKKQDKVKDDWQGLEEGYEEEKEEEQDEEQRQRMVERQNQKL